MMHNNDNEDMMTRIKPHKQRRESSIHPVMKVACYHQLFLLIVSLGGSQSFAPVSPSVRPFVRLNFAPSSQADRRIASKKLFSVAGNETLLIDTAVDSNDLVMIHSNSLLSSDEATSTLEAPSIITIFSFAIPAIGIFLCNPLLSMMDTSTVGLLAGTSQQAALHPATSLTEYSARLLAFLYTGTTSLLAGARKSNDQESASSRLLGALQMSLFVGSILGTILFASSRPLLKLMIGNEDVGVEVLNAATRYVRIRALGMPAAAVIGSSQAACLGLKDAQSPLRIITTAAVVNGISDLALVGLPMAWLGGAAGASWATILAQYTAAGMFLRWLFKKDPIGGKNSISSPTKGLLSSVSLRKAIGQVLPPKSIMAGYRPFVLPVTMSTVSRCAVYICMGHVVSSSLGTSSMAAQQIITSVFYSLIPIADSLSLTAQSFIPPILKDDKVASSEKAKVMRKTIFNLAKAAGVFGVFLASVVATLPVAVRVFTADTSVISLVNSIVPILFSVAIFHGVFCGSEGILLAQKDLGFLGRMYGLYFCIVPVLMLSIKRAASQGMPVELRSVWTLFLQYQAFRISVWVSRVLWLQSRISKPNEKAEDQQFLKLSIRDRILSSWLARKRPQRVRPG